MTTMEQDGEFGILTRVQLYLYLLSQKRNYEYLVKTYPEITETQQLLTCDWMPYRHKIHMLLYVLGRGKLWYSVEVNGCDVDKLLQDIYELDKYGRL